MRVTTGDNDSERDKARDFDLTREVALAHLERGCDLVTPVERRAICKWAARQLSAVTEDALLETFRVARKAWLAHEFAHDDGTEPEDHYAAAVGIKEARAAFETWATPRFNITHFNDGWYFEARTRDAWDSWRAAKDMTLEYDYEQTTKPQVAPPAKGYSTERPYREAETSALVGTDWIEPRQEDRDNARRRSKARLQETNRQMRRQIDALLAVNPSAADSRAAFEEWATKRYAASENYSISWHGEVPFIKTPLHAEACEHCSLADTWLGWQAARGVK